MRISDTQIQLDKEIIQAFILKYQDHNKVETIQRKKLRNLISPNSILAKKLLPSKPKNEFAIFNRKAKIVFKVTILFLTFKRLRI